MTLRADLSKLMGGWTAGILTMLLALVGPIIGYYTNDILGGIWMIAWLSIHIIWGSAGYYPRSFR